MSIFYVIFSPKYLLALIFGDISFTPAANMILGNKMQSLQACDIFNNQSHETYIDRRRIRPPPLPPNVEITVRSSPKLKKIMET